MCPGSDKVTLELAGPHPMTGVSFQEERNLHTGKSITPRGTELSAVSASQGKGALPARASDEHSLADTLILYY